MKIKAAAILLFLPFLFGFYHYDLVIVPGCIEIMDINENGDVLGISFKGNIINGAPFDTYSVWYNQGTRKVPFYDRKSTIHKERDPTYTEDQKDAIFAKFINNRKEVFGEIRLANGFGESDCFKWVDPDEGDPYSIYGNLTILPNLPFIPYALSCRAIEFNDNWAVANRYSRYFPNNIHLWGNDNQPIAVSPDTRIVVPEKANDEAYIIGPWADHFRIIDSAGQIFKEIPFHRYWADDTVHVDDFDNNFNFIGGARIWEQAPIELDPGRGLAYYYDFNTDTLHEIIPTHEGNIAKMVALSGDFIIGKSSYVQTIGSVNIPMYKTFMYQYGESVLLEDYLNNPPQVPFYSIPSTMNAIYQIGLKANNICYVAYPAEPNTEPEPEPPAPSELLVTGDLNGDGNDDMISVNSIGQVWYTTDLSSWANIPGTFETIITGDFDGDGDDDIAGINPDGVISKIFYTTDLVNWIPIPGLITSIVAGDFDGDGDDDIAGINPDGLISKIFYTTDLVNWTPIPGLITSIVTGDLDGDGDDDIAGINPDGIISKIFYTTNLSTWTPIPGLITLIITGDFDGDGVDDIAGINPNGVISKIFYTIDLSSWDPMPGLITSIAAGDFDGDGDDDIAGINPAGMIDKIFYTTDLSSWTTISGMLDMIVAGGFDDDGRDDLAGINSIGETLYTTDFATWTEIE